MKSFKTEIYTLDVIRLSAIYGEQLKYGRIENDCILNLDDEICYRNGEKTRVLEINGDDYILESEGRFILTKDELTASQIRNLENSMKRTIKSAEDRYARRRIGTPEHREMYGDNFGAEGYKYVTAHGVAPSTLPRDVNVLASEEMDNGYVVFWTDRWLDTNELEQYDIKPEGNFERYGADKYDFINGQVVKNGVNMKQTMEHDLIAQGYTQDEIRKILDSRKKNEILASRRVVKNNRLIKNGTCNYWQDMDEFPIVIYEADEDVESYRAELTEDDWGYDLDDDTLRVELEEMDYGDAYANAQYEIDNYDFKTIKAEIESGYYVGLQLIFSELDGDGFYWDYTDEDGEWTEEFHRDREEDIQKGNELINELCGYGWQKIGVVGSFSNGEAVYTRLDNACGKKKGKKKAIKSELDEPTDEVEHMNTKADREWAEQKKLRNARKPITNANTDGIRAQMEYTLESCRDFAEDYGDNWDGSDAQAVKMVLDDVVRVKGRNGKIRGNIQEAIADWLGGLPMNIAFENYKILQLGEQWGYLPKVDYNSGDYTAKEYKWVDNWFMGIANNILKLARKYKVETPTPAFNSRRPITSATIREVRDLAESFNTRFEKAGLKFRWEEASAYGMFNFGLVLPNDGRGAHYTTTGYGSKNEVYQYLKRESYSILYNVESWKERQEEILGNE